VIEKYPDFPIYLPETYFYLGRVALAQNNFPQAEALFKKATSVLGAVEDIFLHTRYYLTPIEGRDPLCTG
jgi:lipoprotein NlpI